MNKLIGALLSKVGKKKVIMKQTGNTNFGVEITEIIVNLLAKMYPKVHFDYEYDKDTNTYEIWYNDESLRNNKRFMELTGKFIKTLQKFDIYNVFIDYSHEKSSKLKEEK